MKKLYISIAAILVCYGAFAQMPAMTIGGSVGGAYDDLIISTAGDNAGNVYIGGYFTGSADFEQFLGTSTATGHGTSASDGFVAKYNSTGTLQWTLVLGSTDIDVVSGVVADANNVYVTGFFRGTVNFNPLGSASNKVSNSSTSDVFIAKYTNAGILVWVNTFGSYGADYGNTIALDASSNVYVGGSFQNAVNFDPAGATGNLKTSNGLYDIFLAKYNSSGTHIWSHKIGSSADDAVNDIVVSGNNVFIGGEYSGLLYVDQAHSNLQIGNLGLTDGYLGHYNANDGAFVWGGSIRSTSDDNIASLVIDGDNVFSLGTFSASAEMYGENSSNVSKTSAGETDVFVSNHSISSHNLYWMSSFGGTSYDYGTAIAFQGNLVIGGTFSGTANFDPHGTANLTANSTDAYIMKMSADGGNYVAASKVSGTDFAITQSLTNANGIIIWAGQYKGTVDIDPGSGTTSRTSAGMVDSFICALTPVEPTVSAGAIQFLNISETGYEMKFNNAPRADGYLIVRSTVASPTFTPADGTSYATNFTSGNDIVTYTGYYDHISQSNVVTGTKYYTTVYPYNGSGSKINYKTSSPSSGNVTPSADAIPPTIVDNSPKTTPVNTDIKISAKVTDASGVGFVSINYRSISASASDVQNAEMTKASVADGYEFIISKSYINEQGVEYEIVAEDNYGNEYSTPVSSIVIATTNGFKIDHTSGKDQEDYTIIALPLELTNKTVNSVFDELGNYDKTKYRLYEYRSGANSELNGSSALAPGRGYWFISADNKDVFSGGGTTVNVGLNNPFTVSINNGWNLIGNPFNKVVSTSDIKNTSGNNDKTLSSFRAWENGNYVEATSLKIQRGVFVMVDNAGNSKLEIPVNDDGIGRIASPPSFAHSLDSETWGVDFVLKSGVHQNTFGGFGMTPDAQDQNDQFDEYTLPRFINYLELNHNKTLYGSAFTKDIVPTSAQHVWDFTIDSSYPDDVMDLSWNNSYFGTSDQELVLWDVEQQRTIDMKRTNSYSFSKERSRTFKVYYGSASFVRSQTLPDRALFHNASPVPSSGNVTLAFTVPGGQEKTNLSIYNLMGQKVANLVDNSLEAGYHEAVWNIEESSKPAAGVYISVLKHGGTTLQKRLVIK